MKNLIELNKKINKNYSKIYLFPNNIYSRLIKKKLKKILLL